MKIEKTTLKTEAIFSDNRKQRYMLRKEWDKSKDKATVIMISPSSADSIVIDLTTQLVINNLSQLGFGCVDIVNLYSIIGKLHVKGEDEETKIENIKAIMQSADKSTKIILAYGSIGKSNKTVAKRIEELTASLTSYGDKLVFLSDVNGENLYHPLVPNLRNKWYLKPFIYVPNGRGGT